MNMNLGDTQLILKATKGLPRKYRAYILATAYHETAHTMKPVREYGGEVYLKKKKYYPYVGMGYVQLTWLENYEKAKKELGIDFVAKPSLLLVPEYAVKILVAGMTKGWFTGKKLSDYTDYKSMRRIVNGTDKADLIASYAVQYEQDIADLEAGVNTDTTAPVSVPDSVPEKKAPTLLKLLLQLLQSFQGLKK